MDAPTLLRYWFDFGFILLGLDVFSGTSMIRHAGKTHGPLRALLFGVGLVLGNIFFILGAAILPIYLADQKALREAAEIDVLVKQHWERVNRLEAIGTEVQALAHKARPTLWDHIMDDDDDDDD